MKARVQVECLGWTVAPGDKVLQIVNDYDAQDHALRGTT